MQRKRGNPNWVRGGASPNPSGGSRIDAAVGNDSSEPFAMRINRRLDAWMNQTTGLGILGRDKTVNTGFQLEVVDIESARDIWQGDPIGARLVEMLPNECTRQGFELCIGDDEPPDTYKPPEPQQVVNPAQQPGTPPAAAGKPAPKPTKMDAKRAFAKKHPSAFARITRKAIARLHMDAGDAKPLQEAITKKIADLGLSANLRECLCYERAGGGAAMMLGANDYTTDLRLPLDLKKVRTLEYLTPLEAREIIPMYYYNDPFSPKFGQCAIYQLVPYVIGAPVDAGKYLPKVTQIHESRLIVFPGIRVTRRRTMTSFAGWGDNIFTRVNGALRGFNVGHQSAEILLSDFAQAIYKIKGLAAQLIKNPNALTDAMFNVELGRSIARAVVLDSEEEFERKSTTMTGYSDTLDRLTQRLAAAGDTPLTLLMGTSPAGLNATGASDVRFWYDRVASMQTQKVAPIILRIVEILLVTMKQDPDKVNHSVKFKSLWQPTEKEIAEAHYIQAQADALYITNDVASAEEISLSRFGGDAYSYETRIDFEARSNQEAVVAPTVEAKPTPPPMATGPIPDGSKDPSANSEGQPPQVEA